MWCFSKEREREKKDHRISENEITYLEIYYYLDSPLLSMLRLKLILCYYYRYVYEKEDGTLHIECRICGYKNSSWTVSWSKYFYIDIFTLF